MTSRLTIETKLDWKAATDRALDAFRAIGGEMPIVDRAPHILTGEVYFNFRAMPFAVTYVPGKSRAQLVIEASGMDFLVNTDDPIERFADAFNNLDDPDFTPEYSGSGAKLMEFAAGAAIAIPLIAAIVYVIFFYGK